MNGQRNLKAANGRPAHVVGLGGTLREDSRSLWALERSLAAAREAGATTELLDLRVLNLPMYVPGQRLADFGPGAEALIAATRRSDAMIWSTGAYHGTLAGVTKNAFDFYEFLSGGDRPYLSGRVVGLIATAGGDQAGVNTIGTMVKVVHSLRGMAAPLSVPIAKAGNVFTADGELTDDRIAERLDMLGELVVDLAARLQPAARLQSAGDMHPAEEVASAALA